MERALPREAAARGALGPERRLVGEGVVDVFFSLGLRIGLGECVCRPERAAGWG